MMSKQVTHLRISPQELSDWSQGIFAQHQQELKQLASQEKLPTNLLVAWWMLLFFLIPEIHNIVIDIFPDILDVNFVLVGVAYIALGLTPLGFIKHQLIKSSQIERDRLQLKFQETYPGLSLLANKVKDHNQIIDEFTRLQESLGTRASVEAGQTELRQGLDISKVNFRRAFEQGKAVARGVSFRRKLDSIGFGNPGKTPATDPVRSLSRPIATDTESSSEPSTGAESGSSLRHNRETQRMP